MVTKATLKRRNKIRRSLFAANDYYIEFVETTSGKYGISGEWTGTYNWADIYRVDGFWVCVNLKQIPFKIFATLEALSDYIEMEYNGIVLKDEQGNIVV